MEKTDSYEKEKRLQPVVSVFTSLWQFDKARRTHTHTDTGSDVTSGRSQVVPGKHMHTCAIVLYAQIVPNVATDAGHN